VLSNPYNAKVRMELARHCDVTKHCTATECFNKGTNSICHPVSGKLERNSNCRNWMYTWPYSRTKPFIQLNNLETRKSNIHRKGLFAKGDILQGTWVIVYLGQIKREAELTNTENTAYYRYCRGFYIDCNRMGGQCKYLNHSCKPTLQAHHYNWQGMPYVAFLAYEDIFQGTELTILYPSNHGVNWLNIEILYYYDVLEMSWFCVVCRLQLPWTYRAP